MAPPAIRLRRAKTDWLRLWVDVLLLLLGAGFMIACYRIDSHSGARDLFQRSGAVAVLLAGIVAYRSLSGHYQKFFSAEIRGELLRTSIGQVRVDVATLALSIVGTAVWGYGDKMF